MDTLHYQTQQLSHQEGQAASQSPQHVKAVYWGAIGVTDGLQGRQHDRCGGKSMQGQTAGNYECDSWAIRQHHCLEQTPARGDQTLGGVGVTARGPGQAAASLPHGTYRNKMLGGVV